MLLSCICNGLQLHLLSLLFYKVMKTKVNHESIVCVHTYIKIKMVNVLVSGERRIRVHTLSLPVANQLSQIYASADQQAIVALLAKMGKMMFEFDSGLKNACTSVIM